MQSCRWRERVEAELIASRDRVVARFRALRDEADAPGGLIDPIAPELVLLAAAAIGDGSPPETPWVRCGGVLRLDVERGEEPLLTDLALLWRAMTQLACRAVWRPDEEAAVREALSAQLQAVHRGARAELSAALAGHEADPAEVRFGGVRLVCFSGADSARASRAA